MAPALVACLREASEQIGWRVKPHELTARIRGSRRGIAGEVGTDGDVSRGEWLPSEWRKFGIARWAGNAGAGTRPPTTGGKTACHV